MDSDKKGFLMDLTCRTNRTRLSYRRKTKNIKSELGGILMKKGCKEGVVSL
ncbi:glycine cleavage system protein T [Capnocytophaga ochracea]|uniref:glycine cleavage system protein T n=1 Tax=Capnocytophaga TaxID=1016 RepID=UPI0009E76307|nr:MULTISPECIES: glycine cleavage system protein T [Capnocytophaga]MEB3015945.1 glycine cleavage system protein T [Capnocytophaga ochracea]